MNNDIFVNNFEKLSAEQAKISLLTNYGFIEKDGHSVRNSEAAGSNPAQSIILSEPLRVWIPPIDFGSNPIRSDSLWVLIL
jgi:hypothetical protein